jgi:glycosyltransferase involved in cell wall biosynthesis
MPNLRLAVFNTQPPTYLGGVERRILEIAKRLQPQVETTVYSGTKGGLKKPATVEGVSVVPLRSTDLIFPLDNWTFNRSLAKNWSYIKADVYETHTASGYGLDEAFRKRGVKVPFVQTVHGVLADEHAQASLRGGLSLRERVANLFMGQLADREGESARNATLVVTISHYSRQKIVEFYGVDASKIRLVPNGVDTARFTPEGDSARIQQRIGLQNRLCVLFVGRLIPRKGLNYLVEAAKRVTAEKREVLFVLVGNGSLKSRLEADVQRAGLAGNFLFMGDVSEEDLPAVYRCCDVFAFPSIQEGQGIALLEAQASAKPVVAFNVSGVAEAVRNRETGLLVEPGSVAGLAEALGRLLFDAELRRKMGTAGRAFVQKELSWDLCAKRMLGVYQEAAKTVGQ